MLVDIVVSDRRYSSTLRVSMRYMLSVAQYLHSTIPTRLPSPHVGDCWDKTRFRSLLQRLLRSWTYQQFRALVDGDLLPLDTERHTKLLV